MLKTFKFFSNQYFFLGVILSIAFLVRAYKIDSPIADWHSWRQADTAAVTRNFVKEGFKPLYPKFDDMSGISEHPIPNPNRFRFVEFPIYNIATLPLYLFFGIADKYSRLVSVLFSIGSIVFLYLICKRYLGICVALLIAVLYSLLPFNIFFSRTTLPEPTFLFFALGMMYFVDKWIWEKRVIWGIWGILFTAIAFLMKPWAIFFTPPLVYSLLVRFGIRKVPKKFIFFAVFSILPFIFWRLWILQQPEGIPASSWLLNSDNIRFRPAFWWWLVSERLGREMLGATGLALFIIGLLVKPKNGNYFFHVWILSLFLYLAIFATGNIRHNYYQYILVPVVTVFFTSGFLYLIKGSRDFLPRIWINLIAIILLLLSFYFSWMQVKEFYKINNPDIIAVGQLADRILPEDALIVAPYNGDTAFLYQTNRPGLPFVPLPLPELVSDLGVTHFVSTVRDDKTNWDLRHFPVLVDDPKYVIADLRTIKAPLSPKDPEP